MLNLFYIFPFFCLWTDLQWFKIYYRKIFRSYLPWQAHHEYSYHVRLGVSKIGLAGWTCGEMFEFQMLYLSAVWSLLWWILGNKLSFPWGLILVNLVCWNYWRGTQKGATVEGKKKNSEQEKRMKRACSVPMSHMQTIHQVICQQGVCICKC